MGRNVAETLFQSTEDRSREGDDAVSAVQCADQVLTRRRIKVDEEKEKGGI
jgi:hypothetical protein